jgi:pyrroline-5-carboxylate reductase
LSALTGSGPAFIFVLIESMIEGGIAMGFTATESKDFVLKTMEGAVALLKETEKHPAQLKWEVASPGGTTIAGLREMELMGVRAGMMNTLLACYQRNLQMREEIAK